MAIAFSARVWFLEGEGYIENTGIGPVASRHHIKDEPLYDRDRAKNFFNFSFMLLNSQIRNSRNLI